MGFIGERAKRALHSLVSLSRIVIYIYIYKSYYTSQSGKWPVIRVASYFHEPKVSVNRAYEKTP